MRLQQLAALPILSLGLIGAACDDAPPSGGPASAGSATVPSTNAAATSHAVDPATVRYDDEKGGILTDIRQLTAGFDRAGEAYFSPDMQWIIFQAMPKG